MRRTKFVGGLGRMGVIWVSGKKNPWGAWGDTSKPWGGGLKHRKALKMLVTEISQFVLQEHPNLYHLM